MSESNLIPIGSASESEAPQGLPALPLPISPSESPEGSRRRRSSSKKDRSKSPRKRRPQKDIDKDRANPVTKFERVMIGGCFVLVVVAIFGGGFFWGQRFSQHTQESHPVVHQQDASFPLPESDAVLDEAFTAFAQGNYKVALAKFQAVQEKQPELVGLDYLIAESAYRFGDKTLASESVEAAISKNEYAQEARVLQSMIDLEESKSTKTYVAQLADPNVTVESEIKQLVATHLDDAKAYLVWGDFLRANGSYLSAVDVLHKGVLRADPEQTRELLSAKEKLASLQNKPAVKAPSLSEVTSMNAEQALVAALACMQTKQIEDAASFLDHARESYAPEVFRELMSDLAFTDYRNNPQLRKYFKSDSH